MRTENQLRQEFKRRMNKLDWNKIHDIFQQNNYIYSIIDEHVPTIDELKKCVQELIDELFKDKIVLPYNEISGGRFIVGYDESVDVYINFVPESSRHYFGPKDKDNLLTIRNHILKAKRNHPCKSMEWNKDFWNELLLIPKNDRCFVNIRCDNDMTYIYVGESFPKFNTKEYEDVITIDCGIIEGIELLKALNFDADFE